MGRGLRRGAVALVWAFAVQFGLGMLLNLFVTIPAHHPGAGGANYYATSLISLGWALGFGYGWPLFLHALLGVILSAWTITLFIVSLWPGGRGWRWTFGIAALFTVGATFNGMSFLDYGFDVSSAIMAGCWLVAVGVIVARLAGRSRAARRGTVSEA